MKRFLIICLLVFTPAVTAVANDGPPVIMVLGDSLSAGYGIDQKQGWVNLLQQRLTKQGYPHQVVNASISGDTTAGALFRLENALQEHRPDIVIVELGGNDGLRGLPLAEMKDNLKRIIEKCRASGAKVLLVGMKIPPNYGKDYTDAFEQTYFTLAREYELPLVPFLLEGIADNNALLQSDRIHPNGEAQGMILENVWSVLSQIISRSS